jgi:ATP-dependent Clp protease ATP-binding subunit ClpC
VAKELIGKRGFDPVLGARPLRRALQRDVEDVLAEKILFGDVRSGELVLVDVDDDPDKIAADGKRFTFTGNAKATPAPELATADVAGAQPKSGIQDA